MLRPGSNVPYARVGDDETQTAVERPATAAAAGATVEVAANPTSARHAVDAPMAAAGAPTTGGDQGTDHQEDQKQRERDERRRQRRRRDRQASAATAQHRSRSAPSVSAQIVTAVLQFLVTAAAVFVLLVLVNPPFTQKSARDGAPLAQDRPSDFGKVLAYATLAGLLAVALPYAWSAVSRWWKSR